MDTKAFINATNGRMNQPQTMAVVLFKCPDSSEKRLVKLEASLLVG
jgi:hypothetical protein